MKDLVQVFKELDNVTATNERKEILSKYFSEVAPEDLSWAVHILSDRRIESGVTAKALRDIFLQRSDLPIWLFEESYHSVGDTAETISLLVPAKNNEQAPTSLDQFIREFIIPLKKMSKPDIAEFFWQRWQAWDRNSIFVLNKIVTGALRIGVSFKTIVNVVADVFNLSESHVYARLSGKWTPGENLKDILLAKETDSLDFYPFCLAAPIESELAELGNVQDWQFEWKYDGIRAQIKRDKDHVVIWTRGEEIVSHQFPELVEKFDKLPSNFVLDGEIVVYKDGVLPFNQLQRRLGRNKVSAQILSDFPTNFIAYDVLSLGEGDLRAKPLRERRELLERFCSENNLLISPTLHPKDWDEVLQMKLDSRNHMAEGLMIKKLESNYREGRHRHYWFKYKVDPLSIDAVLIYAQAGSGRRSNLFTDYTFAVWKNDELVPFAKAYSGLDDKEIGELDNWIRRHTHEKFGPVRSVDPVQVFEIGFEGIAQSQRHKSGFAVRFPRILRWRKDKPAKEIDTVETLETILKTYDHV